MTSGPFERASNATKPGFRVRYDAYLKYDPTKSWGAKGTELVPSLHTTEDDPRLRDRFVLLEYFACSIESKDEFEKAFSDMLKREGFSKALFYGRRERHKNGSIYYHVLVSVRQDIDLGVLEARNAFSVTGNLCRWFEISPVVDFEEFKKYYNAELVIPGGSDCFGTLPLLDAGVWKVWHDL
ncbi:hypothetical protein N7460_006755 [Penicillium canescens]|uniref:Uncharacterized protein n=1 Tax=Penicillium canescens TaxID=5083 RepID=A0AAD6IBS5_PENCN|nr:hypothetical protein N7460_006755 [Penicillium canescens]KAJ6065861.1 hypothetical protein N7444_001514 [Penicillium canescens]